MGGAYSFSSVNHRNTFQSECMRGHVLYVEEGGYTTLYHQQTYPNEIIIWIYQVDNPINNPINNSINNLVNNPFNSIKLVNNPFNSILFLLT